MEALSEVLFTFDNAWQALPRFIALAVERSGDASYVLGGRY